AEVVPPILLRDQPLESTMTTVNIALTDPTRLWGSLRIPPDASLEGWSLDIVDELLGRPISTVRTFGKADAGGTTLDYSVHFRWADKNIHPVVRLRPPDGGDGPTEMPTVLWDLAAALGISAQPDPQLDLDISDMKLKARPVQVTVLKYQPMASKGD